MKKAWKIVLFIFSLFLITFLSIFTYFNILTLNVKLDSEKLISFTQTIVFYDKNNQIIQKEYNGQTITDSASILPHTKNAFIAIEDKRYYSHNGIDYKGLLRATFNNIKSFSLKEGASTISQQLIKNTHLSSEKTLKRKLSEIKLAKQLEKKYTKEEILEKYLNTIYFGDNCYGITSAAKYYFDKSPNELNINESAMLAAIIKAPTNYSPFNNYTKCIDRKNLVLKEMLSQNFITKDEYNENLEKDLVFSENNSVLDDNSYLREARKQVYEKINNSPYKNTHLNVYTYLDSEKQQIINYEYTENQHYCNKSSILMDKNGHIEAYYSTCTFNTKRQIGSVIKPLLCYAPAIEQNKIQILTKITDEPTDFNGYKPQNFNSKYLGEISCQKALSTSSNVCAIKVLNYVGINKAKSYLEKTDIPLSENDNSLVLALGCTENGATLSQITSTYSVFNNQGYYTTPTFIDKITDKNGEIIYKNTNKSQKIYENETVSLMNEMLRDVVVNGTAKKLNFCKPFLYGKTGTVGNKNGNTDAYSISYTNEYILGTWFGNNENSYLDNNITGGNEPTKISASIWDSIYENKKSNTKIELCGDIKEEYIDKISYENENKLILADNNAPEKYKIKTIFKNDNLPKEQSTRFSLPIVEKPILSVNHKGITMSLCLPQYYELEIYKIENGKYKKIYDTLNNNKNEFIDNEIISECLIDYKVIPYYFDGKNKHFGKEIYLEKIKSPNIVGDEWWQNE